MLRVLENPMVVDSLWRHREQEPKVVAECPGCQEDITEGEEVLEFTDVDGETVLVHQDLECTYQYVAGMARCKVAGE
jgi:hypothetical protein